MDKNVMALQQKYAMSQEIEEKLNLIAQQVNELETFGASLKDLDSGEKNILAGLGKGVFIPAEIKDNELYVGVGSGIFVKKSPGDAREVVKNQVQGLLKMREELSVQLDGINQELQEMIQNIEKK